MRLLLKGCALLGLLLLFGCSDDDAPQPDMGVDVVDYGVDTLAPDSAVEENMGEGCKTKDDCKPGSPECVIFDSDNGLGICSRTCIRQPLLNDCPDGFACAEFSYTSGNQYYYCLKACEPSLTTNPCPASSKQTCHPSSKRFMETSQSVCWYAACKDGKDCPVNSDKPCIIDSDCTDVGTDAFCDRVARKCAKPGNCRPGGICGEHSHGNDSAKAGDLCKNDFDCPGIGYCNQEEKFASGSIGVSYRNGYCVTRYCMLGEAKYACKPGSTCNRLYYGGVCFKTCDPEDASTCRGQPLDQYGDYECYNWMGFNPIGSDDPVADVPICLNAATQTCDNFPSGADCASIGLDGNPTNMRCRDRRTGEDKTSANDPSGICSDNTVSGPFGGPSDAGPDVTPDSGPDAGPDAAPDGATDTTPDTTAPDTTAPDTTAPDTTAAG